MGSRLTRPLGDALKDAIAKKASKEADVVADVLRRAENLGVDIPENKRISEMAEIAADLKSGMSEQEAAASLRSRRQAMKTDDSVGPKNVEGPIPPDLTAGELNPELLPVGKGPRVRGRRSTSAMDGDVIEAEAITRQALPPGNIEAPPTNPGKKGALAAGALGLGAVTADTRRPDTLTDAINEPLAPLEEGEPLPVTAEEEEQKVDPPSAAAETTAIETEVAPESTDETKLSEAPRLDTPSRGPRLATPEVYQTQFDELDSSVKKFGENYGQSLDEQELAALGELQARQTELQQLYSDAVKRTEWAEVAELFGKALARIGAGLYGLRTGTNVTGGDFSPSDWSKRYDRHLREMQSGIEQAEKIQSAKVDRIGALRKEYQDLGRRRDTAARELGDARYRTDAANASNEERYQDRLQRVQEFNTRLQSDRELREATLTNQKQLAELRAQAQKDNKAERKSDYLENLLLRTAAQTFTADRRAWQQSEARVPQILGQLRAAGAASKNKEAAALARQGLNNLRGAYDANTLSTALASATEKGMRFNPFSSDSINWTKLADSLEAAPRAAEPKLEDYINTGKKRNEVERNVTTQAAAQFQPTSDPSTWEGDDADAFKYITDNINSADARVQEAVQAALEGLQMSGRLTLGE